MGKTADLAMVQKTIIDSLHKESKSQKVITERGGCIKVWSLEEDWRGTESKQLEVQCEVSEVRDDLGCRDVCWCWFIGSAVYQEILEHFILPSADKLYGDADFLFQQDFSTCPQCQNHFQAVC